MRAFETKGSAMRKMSAQRIKPSYETYPPYVEGLDDATREYGEDLMASTDDPHMKQKIRFVLAGIAVNH